jgi:hypothetical protein
MLHEADQLASGDKDSEAFSIEAFINNFVMHVESIFAERFID